MNVGIVGAAGYSGETLMNLLLRHPEAKLTTATSRKHAGKPVDEVIPSLRGRGGELRFTASDPQALANQENLDLVFLALPHGVASEYAVPLAEAGKKVIDLSADFRLLSAERYEEFYGHPHPAPAWLSKSAYVIPEFHEDSWKSMQLIASPGCYPTSMLMPLLPLVKEGIISTDNITVFSMSGVSGAGKKAAEDFIYCERNESTKAYSFPKHRHLSEVEEQLGLAAGKEVTIQFLPHLVPMHRGIATTISLPASTDTLDKVYACWEKQYQDKPFVCILPSNVRPDTKHVSLTNRVDISACYDERTQKLLITSAEDNLVKGAAGQAVQIMNLWCGYEETAGLL